ncbi:MAG: MaoC family dehydratase N-terminal domain-containing protein [Pseudomonadota bacterium]|nr:MaoC family dehydratase N-terminal domain-containing protein [Pseudomonadota bacterium]
MPTPLEEIHADYVARYGTPRTEVVEYGRVRDYLLALNEPADLADGTPVPALFVLTLGRTRRPQPARGSVVNAGDDYEFFAPVFIGDSITIARRVLGVTEKRGRHGTMYLTRAEATYLNQKGALVARAQLSLLRWGW